MTTIPQALQLAIEHHNVGRLPEAESIYRQVLSAEPNNPDALHLLGVLAHQVGRHDTAIELISRACTAAAKNPNYHISLAQVCTAVGNVQGSLDAYGRAVQADPNNVAAFAQLGSLFQMMGRLDDAANHLYRAASLAPDNVQILNSLGGVLWTEGRIAEAIDVLKRASELAPDSPTVHSNYLLSIGHIYPYDPDFVYREHRRWAQTHADPLTAKSQPFTNDRDPDRKLRVGYVSPQFRAGAGAFFIEPLLAGHDRERCEVICYSDVRRPDEITTRCRAHANVWHETGSLSDDQLFDLIRADKIDILVDVGGHLTGNRLLVFARKPVPVQVTYIGYQDTTGMTQIQYRFSDAQADPPGMTDQHFSEEIIRLPRTAYCYRPPDKAPQVSPLPAEKNGYITFGSSNRTAKIMPEVLSLWASILRAMPTARMILKSDGLNEPSLRHAITGRFSAEGINPNRLELIGWGSFDDYLKMFDRIDLVLDTFPFNGHTVTCHSLWMGVPVVTLEGSVHVGRMGRSILNAVGLPELVTPTIPQYRDLALSLANDLPRLASLRSGMRKRMLNSPMLDQIAFGKDVSNAYREMWKRWVR